MKYVNQPIINARQKLRLKSVVKKADLIINKDSEHKEITREKENLKMWSP